MIWATVSLCSCFCRLYRVSPSSAAKNIINLILVLTIWWGPCVVFSCVVGRGYWLWRVHSLVRILLAFALLHCVLQGQICLLLQVFLNFLLLYSSISQSLLKLMSIEWMMLSKHLILCCPLLLLPSIFLRIRIFSTESALLIRWPKYLSFNISPSIEYSGLICFGINWFDLLALQGTLKSFL